MKLCSDDCKPICDFCTHYNFNGDKDGVYIDDGYCDFHKMKKDPIDECDDFTCKLIRRDQ